MSSTQNNNTNLAIATLNKFAIESIKIIEDLKLQLLDQQKNNMSLVNTINKKDTEIVDLKDRNHSLVNAAKAVLAQPTPIKAKKIKATKIKSDTSYFTAFDTEDFIKINNHNWAYIVPETQWQPENDDEWESEAQYEESLKLDSVTPGQETITRSCLGCHHFPTTYKAKKYMYANVNAELAEKVFLSYTKKELVAFAMDTMGDWQHNTILTSDKLIVRQQFSIGSHAKDAYSFTTVFGFNTVANEGFDQDDYENAYKNIRDARMDIGSGIKWPVK